VSSAAAVPYSNSPWRKLRRRIPAQGGLVFRLATLISRYVPPLCLTAAFFSSDPGWAATLEATRLLWLLGLAAQLMAMGLGFLMLRRRAPLAGQPKSGVAALAVMALLTGAALAFNRIDLAAMLKYAVAPWLTIGFGTRKPQAKEFARAAVGVALIPLLFLGLAIPSILLAFGLASFELFQHKDLWDMIASKPTRKAYLESQHQSCAIGGG
jgi:hypothetical protein